MIEENTSKLTLEEENLETKKSEELLQWEEQWLEYLTEDCLKTMISNRQLPEFYFREFKSYKISKLDIKQAEKENIYLVNCEIEFQGEHPEIWNDLTYRVKIEGEGDTERISSIE